MLFKNLIDRVGYLDVFTVLVNYYGINRSTAEAHLKVLMDLKGMTPRESKMVLACEWVKGHPSIDPGCDGYWHVFGEIDDTQDIESCCLEFTPWAEWLGMEIKNPHYLSDSEFVAHCLYEMTFYGFTEAAIQNLMDDIEKNIEECVNELEPYTKSLDIQSVFM